MISALADVGETAALLANVAGRVCRRRELATDATRRTAGLRAPPHVAAEPPHGIFDSRRAEIHQLCARTARDELLIAPPPPSTATLLVWRNAAAVKGFKAGHHDRATVKYAKRRGAIEAELTALAVSRPLLRAKSRLMHAARVLTRRRELSFGRNHLRPYALWLEVQCGCCAGAARRSDLLRVCFTARHEWVDGGVGGALSSSLYRKVGPSSRRAQIIGSRFVCCDARTGTRVLKKITPVLAQDPTVTPTPR